MNFLIFGAGAVGLTFGGFLRKAGHAVTLVGRPAVLQTVADKGVRITGLWGEHHVTGFSLAPTAAEARGDFDAILVCVKSFDTRQAVKEIVPFVRPETLIVSLQNGLGNVEALREVTGQAAILGGRVIFGMTPLAPNHIDITVYAQPVEIGFPAGTAPSTAAVEKAKALSAAIQGAGIPCQYSTEIDKHLWAKLLYNCALNPLGALHGVHYGALSEKPAWKAAMDGVVREIFAVARAQHIELFWETPDGYLDFFYSKLLPATYHHRSSMLYDLTHGRRTEIDAFCGAVVRKGEALGIPTPLNRDLWEKVSAAVSAAVGVKA